MHVEIVDRTRGKLLLFLPALSALQQMGVSMSFENVPQDMLARLKALELNVHTSLQKRPDARILLTDTETEIETRAEMPIVVYPIWPEKDRKNVPSLSNRNPYFIPVGRQRLMGHILGDVLSLLDVLRYLQSSHPLKGKCFLITAGPTAEDLDPVRYLTNRSSGMMGVALARAAFIYGANVLLVMGPGQASIPAYLPLLSVRSAREMAEAVFQHFEQCHVYIGAAAVADFTPHTIATEKIKKKEETLYLPLTRTIDILETLSLRKDQRILVGFSVETEKTIEHSLQKLKRKNLDLIIVNNPKETGAAFQEETNKVTVIEKNGRIHRWPLMKKFDLGLKIMQLLSETYLK